MPRIKKIKRLFSRTKLAQLTQALLQDALDREERRVGRKLTSREAETLVLKDFEPVLIHWQPHTQY